MDYIHIDNLVFRGKHGCFAKERRIEQEFALSVKLGVDTSNAAQSDNLADTVNYSEVKDKIRAVIKGSSRFLIETLAEEIAHKVLEDKRIQTVEVTIQKPEVWQNGVPGVTIVRSREN